MKDSTKMAQDKTTEAAVIAEQNDLFRTALIDPTAAFDMQKKDIQGQVLVTQGVSGEGAEFHAAALLAVASFDTFNQDNDPYGDHTFGAVTVMGQKLFWKIDLYDQSYLMGSVMPTDVTKTRRVLTIMTPSEY